MFVDYSSGKAALQALDYIVPFLRDHCPSRMIKPVAYIKGGEVKEVEKKALNNKTEKRSALPAACAGDFCRPRKPVCSTGSVAIITLSPNHHAGLWIGNLPTTVTEAELKTFFASYGPIHSIKVCAFCPDQVFWLRLKVICGTR